MYFHLRSALFFRLTPLYGFVIFMFVTLYPKLVEGPMWPEVSNMSVEVCKKQWYTNLLYINNLYAEDVEHEVTCLCFAVFT